MLYYRHDLSEGTLDISLPCSALKTNRLDFLEASFTRIDRVAVSLEPLPENIAVFDIMDLAEFLEEFLSDGLDLVSSWLLVFDLDFSVLEQDSLFLYDVLHLILLQFVCEEIWIMSQELADLCFEQLVLQVVPADVVLLSIFFPQKYFVPKFG